MVHIYVSLDKLAQKLASVGMLSHPQQLRTFAQGFSVNQPLFSIIDVGHGKERADHKIKGTAFGTLLLVLLIRCDCRNASHLQRQPHMQAYRLWRLS
jgi:hypothetical protein